MNSNYLKFVEYLNCLNLDSQVVDEIIKCFTVKKYQKYKYFASSWELSDKIGFVVDGLFYMYTVQSDGTLFVKEFMKENQFLLSSLNPTRESNVYIKSIQNSVILEAKYSEIQNLFHKYHNLEMLSKNKVETEFETICQRMEHYASMPAIDRYMLFRQKYSTLEDAIPQFLIASYLGITPTHLCRIKTNLKSN
jgi:signal-transduction protein with cAMP-binding, CBS, and nucleotidyltransferase domain